MKRILAALVLFASMATAEANPILLAKWGPSGGGTADALLDYRDATEVVFGIGYDWTGQAGTNNLGVCLGCIRIPLANVAAGNVYQFTQANSPGWAAFISRLTDNVDDDLYFNSYLYNSSNPLWYSGISSSNPESYMFANFAPTWTVDSVHVTINRLTVGPPTSCPTPSGCQPGLDFYTLATLEIWGTGTPAPPVDPLPEVPQLATILIGLGALTLPRRFRAELRSMLSR